MTDSPKTDYSKSTAMVQRVLASFAFDLSNLLPYLTAEVRTEVGMWLHTVADQCLRGSESLCSLSWVAIAIGNGATSKDCCAETPTTSCSKGK